MQILQYPLHREGHHRVEAIASESLELSAPATHLTSATCVRKPDEADEVECNVAGNVLRTTALSKPGVYPSRSSPSPGS